MAICGKLDRDLLRTTSCGYSLPEVKDIYLANYDEVSATTVTVGVAFPEVTGGCSGNVVTEISMSGNSKWYHIEPTKNSVTFEDTLTVEDNGNKYRTHNLTFNVGGKYDQCLHDDLDALALGRFMAVVLTADGTYLMLGRLGGLEAETATIAGGGDNNGLQVVLTANVTESAVPLSEAAVNVVKGGA